MIANTSYKERLMDNMDLKIGDLVVFKKYEDMTKEERLGLNKDAFPESGKVEIIFDSTENIKIEGTPYAFPEKSIDYVIAKSATDDIRVGDEVLVKTTVREVTKNHIWVSWISKDDVVKVLKRKEEHFIVQEDHYGMYINGSEVLVINKDDAKIFNSRHEANEAAANMHLRAWKVVPYDD